MSNEEGVPMTNENTPTLTEYDIDPVVSFDNESLTITLFNTEGLAICFIKVPLNQLATEIGKRMNQ